MSSVCQPCHSEDLSSIFTHEDQEDVLSNVNMLPSSDDDDDEARSAVDLHPNQDVRQVLCPPEEQVPADAPPLFWLFFLVFFSSQSTSSSSSFSS